MTLYWTAGALFGVAGASALVLANDHQSLPWLIVYLGASFCAVGVVASLRRPDNATGSLLYLVRDRASTAEVRLRQQAPWRSSRSSTTVSAAPPIGRPRPAGPL